MEKSYQIFRLAEKETHEPDAYCMKTITTSKLEHVGCGWIETEADAIMELEAISDGYSKYIILPVYR